MCVAVLGAAAVCNRPANAPALHGGGVCGVGFVAWIRFAVGGDPVSGAEVRAGEFEAEADFVVLEVSVADVSDGVVRVVKLLA